MVLSTTPVSFHIEEIVFGSLLDFLSHLVILPWGKWYNRPGLYSLFLWAPAQAEFTLPMACLLLPSSPHPTAMASKHRVPFPLQFSVRVPKALRQKVLFLASSQQFFPSPHYHGFPVTEALGGEVSLVGLFGQLKSYILSFCCIRWLLKKNENASS